MQPKKILLVEDDLFIRELYEFILKKEGLEVTCALDGQQAKELAAQKPDLILLDIMLPRLNGLEVLKDLKNNPQTQSIPIVLLTNLGDRDIITQAFDSGASGYIMKVRLSPTNLPLKIKPFLENPNLKMDYKMIPLDN